MPTESATDLSSLDHLAEVTLVEILQDPKARREVLGHKERRYRTQAKLRRTQQPFPPSYTSRQRAIKKADCASTYTTQYRRLPTSGGAATIQGKEGVVVVL